MTRDDVPPAGRADAADRDAMGCMWWWWIVIIIIIIIIIWWFFVSSRPEAPVTPPGQPGAPVPADRTQPVEPAPGAQPAVPPAEPTAPPADTTGQDAVAPEAGQTTVTTQPQGATDGAGTALPGGGVGQPQGGSAPGGDEAAPPPAGDEAG